MTRVYSLIVCTIALTCFMFPGCSGGDRPELAKVSGKIMYQGSPVEGAHVTFHSTGSAARSAIGVTDASGAFQLTTFDTNDGAVLGEHVVTIHKPEASDAPADELDPGDPGAAYDAEMSGAAAPPEKEDAGTTLPEKYASKDSSPERRTVSKEGPNEFTIEVQD